MAITVPGEIDAVFDKPGRDWTFEERENVVIWLNSEPQRSYLLLFAKRQLGCSAKLEDAEDTCQEFYVKRFNVVIDRSDPARGARFWTYLLFCFGRFCHAQLRRKPAISKVVVPGEPIEFELVDRNENVERAAEQKEMLLHLLTCINKLPETHKKIILLRGFEQQTVEEVANELGISHENVRVRLHRARMKLAKCLRRFRGGLTS